MKSTAAKGTVIHMLLSLCTVILVLFVSPCFAQTNAGKDFWVVQTPNGKSSRTDTAKFAIGVANLGSVPATVTITNPIKATVTATINPGSLEMFFFPTENPNIIPSVNPNGNNVVTNTFVNNVYHVTSQQNVVVYSFNPFYNVITNDAALVLPTHALGKKYRTVSYVHPSGGSSNSFFGVVAIKNGTNIKTYNRSGVLIDNVTINKGEYFQRLNGNTLASDVTGWYVEASDPVGVLSGSQATGVGNTNGASDHLDEQLVPIESLALTYIASPTNSRPIGCTVCAQDVFRYVATEDNTVITTSPNVGGGTINKGQYVEITTNIPYTVTGTHPFYGFQYLVSQNSGTPVSAGIGDPSLMAMPVIDQFQFHYVYIIPNSFPSNYLSVTAPAGVKLSLDGTIISPNWINAGTVNGILYRSATIETTSGVHDISANKKFGLVVSGFGPVASYGYMGGSGLQAINAGCISGGPYQALACNSKAVSVQLQGTPSCSDGSAPSKIEWTSENGDVIFSDSGIANPIATVNGPGVYYITLSVTCNGTITTCSTEITVREPLEGCSNITPPVLHAPPAITVPADSARNYASGVIPGVATYTATQPVSIINNGILQYPLGSTIITWTLTDGNGITTSDTQRITVLPPPTIIAPPSVTINNDPGQLYSGNVTLGNATYTSYYNPTTISNDAPAQFPIGNTTVTWTVKDGFNRTASATQIVTVVSAPPTIVAPPAITVTADYNGFASGVVLGAAIYTSSVDPPILSNDGPAQYPIGSTNVTWTITDGLGRTASDVQVVRVLAPLPTIAPPADITVNNDPGVPYATGVNLGTPTYNAVGPVTLTNDAPAQFPLGTTIVTWTLTDVYGNTVTTTQKVTVVSAPPTIVAPPTVTVTAGYNGFASGVVLGTASYTVSVNPATLNNNGIAQYPIGSTNVTWTVTDGLGRTASDVQVVKVLAPLPTIAPPADITVNNNPGAPYATGVNLGTPTYNAVGPVTLTNDAPAQFPLGTTIVTWTLTDVYGNTVTTTQKVTVVSAPPTIVAPPAITVTANSGSFATGVVLGNAAYTVSVNPPVLTNNAPSQFPVGTTTVTWTIKDGLGRTASATQLVTVNSNACQFVSSITSVPTDNTPTGGNPNNLYIGYGAQSTKLQVTVPNTGGPFTFQWMGSGLNNMTSSAPIFTPASAGSYSFSVTAKNANGCKSTSTITICVRDVRSLDKNGHWDGKKVIVCHLPPGNPANVQMIDVSINAVPAHVPLHGGDGLGNSCIQPSCTSPFARAAAPVTETFGVNIYPNPASGLFTLQVKSDDVYTTVTVRILDAFGRTVQVMNNVAVGKPVTFGQQFASGAYYAEVLQGEDRKMIPLMKAK